MEWAKGHHVSLEAVALLRDAGVPVTLDLFGGPLAGNTYVDSLRSRVAQLRLDSEVTIQGYADDFVHRLAEYDIALQSRIDPEPCSLFVLECMNRALPLVASAGGGTPELMRDEREGCLYPPGDAAALAHCVERLARVPGYADRLARNARARVAREFSPERFAGNLAAFYAEVLAAAPERGHVAAAVRPEDEAWERLTG
jgi:glycosyltransferase involved in cell wall biosynthesis